MDMKKRRRARQRGAELLEFTLAFIPLLAMVGVSVDAAWAIFAKATLQRAVRAACRDGVVLTAAQMEGGATLTQTVKAKVQQYSLGLLNGPSGLAQIKVHYYEPPAPTTNAPLTDVCARSDGNKEYNIMEVRVENFSLVPLMPLLFRGSTPDKSPMLLTVSSADRIEPNRTPPPKGTAP